MRLAVVHLSDIHFREGANIIESRRDKLVAALRPVLQEVEQVIFAVTGDVAYSGSQTEYETAFKFFSAIETTIRNAENVGDVKFVFIPGNHDCDFATCGDLRPSVLDGLPKKISDLDPQGQVAQTLTQVQDHFFSFEARLSGLDIIPQSKRLRYQRRFNFCNLTIVFDCYNTAWTSQRDEQQGSLLFPPRLLKSDTLLDDDYLRISLLHHRDNWLESNNARTLREYIETSSEFVLSGHEHVGTRYTKITADGIDTQHLEGAVLQDHSRHEESGFNVIELDFDDEKSKILTFRWRDQRYSSDHNDQWSSLKRNKSRDRGHFQISSEFLKELRDPGAGFFHLSRPNLALEDLFVYPDLRRKSLRRLMRSENTSNSVPGRDIVRFLINSGRVIISGPDDSGKTSLARMLYLDIRRQEKLVPILIDGGDIRGRSPEAALSRQVQRAVFRQYRPEMAEPYEQLERNQKVLIIDDWHKVKYVHDGQALFLQNAEKRFGTVICVSDDTVTVDQLTGGSNNPFRDYEICEIRELGHVKRNELIRKWHSLSSDQQEMEADPARSVARMESAVNSLLGKNLLPSYPVIILAILQSYTTNRSPNSAAGSYGQMYEALITAALASVSKKAVDLGTKYTYVSHIAHHVFRTDKHELQIADLELVHEEYRNEYKVPVDLTEITNQLVTAQILSRTGNTVRFKYKYIYCYFVAKFFQDSIANVRGEGDLRRRLHEIADTVYFEDHANIIIFYVYLTKDRELIEYLLANATRIYRDLEQCDLSTHIDFINRLGLDTKELVLPATDVESNREATLRRKDEAEEQTPAAEEASSRNIKYEDSLTDLIKFHIALRNLRILGQIVRNFPGALKADLKLDLASASYQLGLRTLRAVFLSAEKNVESLRTYIAQLIQEKRALQDREDLAERTDRVLIDLTRNVAFAMMKRISQAVGLEELGETYEAILDRDGKALPIRIIDYTIKLDHFAKFPKADLEKILSDAKKNMFAFRLVRDLTADYLYLFPVENRVRQYVGDALNISVNTKDTLGATSKRLKALPTKD